MPTLYIIRNAIILVLVLICFRLGAQDNRRYIRLGNKMYKQENYTAAISWFSLAKLEKPAPDIAWKIAASALILRDYRLAMKWYQYVAYNHQYKYPMAWYYLGTVQKNLGLYQKAQNSYMRYFNAHKNDKDYFAQKASHEVISCENALFMTFEPVGTAFHILEPEFNTPYSEFTLWNIEDSLIYLNALRPEKEGDSVSFTASVSVYNRDTSSWNKLGILDTTVNIPGLSVSGFCFTPFDELIFSACARKGKGYQCKIYRSVRRGNTWVKAEELGTELNSPGSTNSHPAFAASPEGNFLLWSSDRQGGMGQMDIWYCPYDSNGIGGMAVNGGKGINSIDNEVAPFWSGHDSLLYFSSQWFDNLGGFDVFRVKGIWGEWKNPENLGFPVNSSADDLFYTVSTDLSRAYFASNRQSGNQETPGCCNDIYTYNLPRIVRDSIERVERIADTRDQIRELIPLALYFHNDEPNPRTSDTITTLAYSQTIEPYLAMKEQYITEWSSGKSGDSLDEATREIEMFFLDSVQMNYAKLVQFAGLMEELLQQGENIEITIKGYASPLNNNAYNTNLSKRRIHSLVNYFITYKDGLFIQYLEKGDEEPGRLRISEVAFGEDMVSKGVSDNLKDLKNSVFSPYAMKERKIAVIAVSFK